MNAIEWDMMDIYKGLLALAAGIILGLERELKDKAAGLKTITVITLGAALFSLLSLKIGLPEGESTRIASYVVSGIGFLGAGVIFKNNLNVEGLTTASIIWVAAAIGMSIGFGEIALAAVFLVLTLMAIYLAPLAERIFFTKNNARLLKVQLTKGMWQNRFDLISKIKKYTILCSQKSMEMDKDLMTIELDIKIQKHQLPALEEMLIGEPAVDYFFL